MTTIKELLMRPRWSWQVMRMLKWAALFAYRSLCSHFCTSAVVGTFHGNLGSIFLDSQTIGKVSGMLKDLLSPQLRRLWVLIYTRLHHIHLDRCSVCCIFIFFFLSPINIFSNLAAGNSQAGGQHSHVSTAALIVKSIWPSLPPACPISATSPGWPEGALNLIKKLVTRQSCSLNAVTFPRY